MDTICKFPLRFLFIYRIGIKKFLLLDCDIKARFCVRQQLRLTLGYTLNIFLNALQEEFTHVAISNKK